jgi:hypothetical protein
MAITGALHWYYLFVIEHRSALFHPRCRKIFVRNQTSIIARSKADMMSPSK